MNITSIIRYIAIVMIASMQSGYASDGESFSRAEASLKTVTTCLYCKAETPNKPALEQTRATLKCGHCFHQACLMRVFSVSEACMCTQKIDIETRREYALIKYNETDPALRLVALAEYGNSDEIAKMLKTETFATMRILDGPALAIALYKAAYMNHSILVTLLLNFSDNNSHIVPLDMLEPTLALKVAVQDGRIETVKLLLARVDNTMLMRGYPALEHAIIVAKKHHHHEIEALIRAKLTGEASVDIIADQLARASFASSVEAGEPPQVAASVPEVDGDVAARAPEGDGERLLSGGPTSRKIPSLRSRLTPRWFKEWRAGRRERAWNSLSDMTDGQ